MHTCGEMAERTESLIEAVKKFQCLWDVASKSYKDTKAKENAWKAVAEEVISTKVSFFLFIIYNEYVGWGRHHKRRVC